MWLLENERTKDGEQEIETVIIQEITALCQNLQRKKKNQCSELLLTSNIWSDSIKNRKITSIITISVQYKVLFKNKFVHILNEWSFKMLNIWYREIPVHIVLRGVQTPPWGPDTALASLYLMWQDPYIWPVGRSVILQWWMEPCSSYLQKIFWGLRGLHIQYFLSVCIKLKWL